MKEIIRVLAVIAVITSLFTARRAAAEENNFRLNAETARTLGLSAPRTGFPEPAARTAGSGGNVPAHGYTPGEISAMEKHNAGLPGVPGNKSGKAPGRYRPYADYEKTGYLIMSSDFNFDSRQAKLEMAGKLPADAFLVIFTGDPDAKEGILRDYESAVPRGRIKVITLPRSERGFWARDGIPVPVLDRDNKLTVVDAKYGHWFEPDAEISRLFKAGLEKHDYYFEGGNFQANHSGDCLMVDSRAHAAIPDGVFFAQYGCRNLIRLPFVDGIGHIDERARFIGEKTLVTDTPGYRDILESKGFTVHMLPRPQALYGTYVNSLIMNDRVVVPVFRQETDAQALAVYEALGLKASGADSRILSTTGMGSVHCITMTYPKVPVTDLLKTLGAKEL